MKTLGRNLRSNQGFPPTSQACRNLENSCHESKGTLMRKQKPKSCVTGLLVSALCWGRRGNREGLKATAKQGAPRTSMSASNSLQVCNFVIITKLLLHPPAPSFPLFGKLSELRFFIHKLMNDLSLFFVKSQMSWFQLG